MNIALIGYRGTGKTTLGKKLAERLWMDFVDTDVLVTERANKTIKEIFEAGGEAAFRDLESAIIAEIAERDNVVIALGGGAVLREANVQHLRKKAKVVWLQATAEVLWARISQDSATSATRPNLTALGGPEEIRLLLEKRAPLYEAAADHALDVTRLSPEDAIYHLTRLL